MECTHLEEFGDVFEGGIRHREDALWNKLCLERSVEVPPTMSL